MRMPQTTLPPLAPELEALRQQINALADDDLRALMGRLWGDTIRRNDAREQERYERAEKARNRKRPDPRQMSLEDAA